MEVNSSLDLEGVEVTAGLHVASRIIDFIERHAKPGRTRDSIPA